MDVHPDHKEDEPEEIDPVRELAGEIREMTMQALRQPRVPDVKVPLTLNPSAVHVQPPVFPKRVHVEGEYKGSPFKYTATYEF